jgi:hypothetical protein
MAEIHEATPKKYRIIAVFSGWCLPLRFCGEFSAEEAAPMVCDWNAAHDAHDMVMMEEVKKEMYAQELY